MSSPVLPKKIILEIRCNSPRRQQSLGGDRKTGVAPVFKGGRVKSLFRESKMDVLFIFLL